MKGPGAHSFHIALEDQMLRFLLAFLMLAATLSAPARADSERLDVTFSNVKAELSKALRRVAIHDVVSAKGCLPGGEEKRTVCTFAVGDYETVMAQSAKGGKDVVAITMICGAQSGADAAKCLLAQGAAMMMSTKGQDATTRGKIMRVLVDGLPLGTETRITTDERRYILQKSMGLWFHIYAADAEE